MKANTNKPASNEVSRGASFFGDFTFSDAWITVTNFRGESVQVTEGDLIEEDVVLGDEGYVKVFFCGITYLIPEALHFPL